MTKLTRIVELIRPLDKEAMAQAQLRQDMLTKPQGSLGRLEELSIQLAGIQRKPIPRINQKAIITMAGDHGVVAERVGHWPQEVTVQMVYNFLRGGAGINVLSRLAGVRMVVGDMGGASDLKPDPKLLSKKIGYGTRNMALGPAMTDEQAVKAVETGIDILTDEAAKGLDIVGTGDMGIGNTTASSAIFAAVSGNDIESL